MEITYKRNRNIYYDTEIKFCCDEIKKWFDEGSIECDCNEVWVMGEEDWEYTYGERTQLFKIKYCPFCGRKIEYKEILKKEV